MATQKESKYLELLKDVPNTGKPGSLLAQVFRKIVRRLGLIPIMDVLIQERIAQLQLQYPKEKFSRGPIDKELLKESMTFDSFVNSLVNHLSVDITAVTFDVNFNDIPIGETVVPKIRRKKRKNEK